MKITDTLKMVGKKNPKGLLQKIEILELNEKEFNIIKLRYVDCLLFKQIEAKLDFSDSRWMFTLHKRALNKALNNRKFSKWLHHEITPKSLFIVTFLKILRSAGNIACNFFRRKKDGRNEISPR